jgi:hypothetical protein
VKLTAHGGLGRAPFHQSCRHDNTKDSARGRCRRLLAQALLDRLPSPQSDAGGVPAGIENWPPSPSRISTHGCFCCLPSPLPSAVFLMAAETPPPPAPGSSPEKRALQVPDEGEDEPAPDLKRRRACVAALDAVTCAAAAATEPGSGGCDADGAPFSFQNARAGFVAPEATPKFGSFNPPEPGEQRGLDVEPAPPDGEEDDQGPPSPASDGDEDGEEKSESQSVGVTDKNDGPALTFDHQ